MLLRAGSLLIVGALVGVLAIPTAPALPPPGPATPPPPLNDPETKPRPEDEKPRRLDARAVELGEQVVRSVREARTLTFEITHSLAMRSDIGRQQMDSEFELAMQRPNRFALELKRGMMGETVVSDGETLFTHLPALNAYLEKDAPDEMDDLLVQIVSTGGGMGGGPLSFLVPLVVGPDREKTVKRAEYKGEEELDERTVHRVHYVIEPNMPDEIAEEMRRELGDDFRMTYVFDAWIDGERPIVHKMEFDLAEMMKGMMDQMPEEMRDIEYEMVMTFRDWQINGDVPAERFAFSPPAGAKKVESLMEAFGGMETGSSDPAEALLGRSAPDFELASLDAGTVSLSQHRGRDIVILDFWATWCGPCVRAMPGLIEIAREYRDRNVVLYAVNQREGEETIRAFLRDREWELRVPLDPEGKVAQQYHVRGIPQTVVIDKQGVVQAVHVGYSPEQKDQLRRELDTLLEGRSLVPPRPADDEDDEDESEEEDERDAPGTR